MDHVGDARDVSFESLHEKIAEFVRLPTKKPDTEDVFGELVSFQDENIQAQLGAKVAFKKDNPLCELKAESVRFSTSPDCKTPGKSLKSEDETDLAANGEPEYFFVTDQPLVVLQREPVAEDADASFEGDWTFTQGDFAVKKNESDSTLELVQKFWGKPVGMSGTLDAADQHGFRHVKLSVPDSECRKFKQSNCPGDYCQYIDGENVCKARTDVNYGHLRLKAQSANEMIRESSPDNTSWNKVEVHRSFMPVNMAMSGFVCVFTNNTWTPVRGTTFKQIPGKGPSQSMAKEAKASHGTKIFANVSFGHGWIKEKQATFDSVGESEFLPPWRNAVQATVEWKKAGVCPSLYPLCMDDGSCVLPECEGGCEWTKAPTPFTDPAGGYNYISGYDTLGTVCDLNSEDLHRSSAAGFALLPAFLLVALRFAAF